MRVPSGDADPVGFIADAVQAGPGVSVPQAQDGPTEVVGPPGPNAAVGGEDQPGLLARLIAGLPLPTGSLSLRCEKAPGKTR